MVYFPTFENNSDAYGRRVRLRPKPGNSALLSNSGILRPLRETNGMLFPYQPTITYQQDVNYVPIDLVHTNQEFYAYNRTNAVKLNVSGQFSVQNQTEGVYSLACIHFLRTVTKMYFGQSDYSGTPPPILLFDAYGTYMFNQLPVIVTNFSVTMPNDVDYVPVDLKYVDVSSEAVNEGGSETPARQIPLPDLDRSPQTLESEFLVASSTNNLRSSDGYVWLPSLFNIEVGITVQNSPRRLRQEFNYQEFRSGNLLKSGGWI